MKLYELNPRYLPKVMLISLGRDDRVLQLLFYSLIRQRTRGFLSSYNLCNSALLKDTQMKNFMRKRSIQLLVNILPIVKTLEIVGFDPSKKENITVNYYSHVQPDRCMLIAHI